MRIIGAMYINGHLLEVLLAPVQWELGFMDDAAWQAYRAQLKVFLSWPMSRFILESVGDYYRPSCRDVCYELIAENERESR